MTTEAAITEIFETIGNRPGEWIRLSEVAAVTGLTREDFGPAIEELLTDDSFRAEPEPFSFRITEADQAAAPIIGGEARHLIRWEA